MLNLKMVIPACYGVRAPSRAKFLYTGKSLMDCYNLLLGLSRACPGPLITNREPLVDLSSKPINHKSKQRTDRGRLTYGIIDMNPPDNQDENQKEQQHQKKERGERGSHQFSTSHLPSSNVRPPTTSEYGVVLVITQTANSPRPTPRESPVA
jgi:hypothetical protein